PAAPMNEKRYLHTATLLSDGRVLVTGGYVILGGSLASSSTEIYDPSTDAWTPAAPMRVQRASHAAVRLADGRVLVAGGMHYDERNDNAEVYDPATDEWTLTGHLGMGRYHPETVLL